jgi:hypothetical protein
MAQKEEVCMDVFASYMTFLPEGSHLRIVTDLYPKITAKV